MDRTTSELFREAAGVWQTRAINSIQQSNVSENESRRQGPVFRNSAVNTIIRQLFPSTENPIIQTFGQGGNRESQQYPMELQQLASVVPEIIPDLPIHTHALQSEVRPENIDVTDFTQPSYDFNSKRKSHEIGSIKQKTRALRIYQPPSVPKEAQPTSNVGCGERSRMEVASSRLAVAESEFQGFQVYDHFYFHYDSYTSHSNGHIVITGHGQEKQGVFKVATPRKSYGYDLDPAFFVGATPTPQETLFVVTRMKSAAGKRYVVFSPRIDELTRTPLNIQLGEVLSPSYWNSNMSYCVNICRDCSMENFVIRPSRKYMGTMNSYIFNCLIVKEFEIFDQNQGIIGSINLESKVSIEFSELARCPSNNSTKAMLLAASLIISEEYRAPRCWGWANIGNAGLSIIQNGAFVIFLVLVSIIIIIIFFNFYL